VNFNQHSRQEGQHAFLSASKYHWVNYTEDKLDLAFARFRAAQRGTALHELAHRCILLGVKLPKSNKTLNLYVNDAIGFKMDTEVVLYYSDNCFGTADTISFRNNFLRIHDLKNGVTPASVIQLIVYAALFCLEYKFNPDEIEVELRLYQSNDVIVFRPEPNEVLQVMEKIIAFDKRIDLLIIGG
jgi:hypothetical protein